jgi:hypothetical protein
MKMQNGGDELLIEDCHRQLEHDPASRELGRAHLVLARALALIMVEHQGRAARNQSQGHHTLADPPYGLLFGEDDRRHPARKR